MVPSTLYISGAFTGGECKSHIEVLLFRLHQDLSAAIDDEYGSEATKVFQTAWKEKSALSTGGEDSQEELACLAKDVAGYVSSAMMRSGSRASRQEGGRECMISILRNCAVKSRASESVFATKRKPGEDCAVKSRPSKGVFATKRKRGEMSQARHYHELGDKCREAESLLIEGFRSKMAARDQRGRVGGCRGCTIESMAHFATIPGSLGGRFHTCLEPEEIDVEGDITDKAEAQDRGHARKQGSMWHKAWTSLSSKADSLSRGTWLSLGVAGIGMTLAMVALASASVSAWASNTVSEEA